MGSRIIFLSLSILAIVLVTGASLAALDGDYDLSWWTVDGGGGDSTGTGYSLSGTIGQLDASPELTGGGYSLKGGFWVGAVTQYTVNLPLVLNDHP